MTKIPGSDPTTTTHTDPDSTQQVAQDHDDKLNYYLPDVEKLARTQFVEITAEHWTAICRNVVKVEDKYIINERLLDDALEDFEFMVNAGSSDEDFSPDEDVDDRSPVRHVVDVEITQGGSKPLTSSKWLTKNKDNPNLCPVRLYHLLMMKRGNNINTDRMFLTPNPFWNKIQNAVWYKNSPVGVNEIGKWVKSLVIVTGLDIKRRKISNHSVRSSAVSALAKTGVEEQQLMKITGHQNVNSIKPYLQLDDKHHKSITLINTMFVTRIL
ncbi:hypothetical protein Zmor_028360 [Zophobas morio]|uniref:ZMYM2-like/QRICH1 C-terminal domain-containing protein n=1 Tax=Zophobas morio TaxID=2755281 RepID=A0AA38HQ95_9CUCU|nr:hypothetical protein Zmor_028360 [Zophobas morio]